MDRLPVEGDRLWRFHFHGSLERPIWYLKGFEKINSNFQVANTWPKITARDTYKMVRNGKERENLDFSSVAATFEKANTYVFAESLIRNAEVRGSIPLCSTNNIHLFQ
jgi:hypothetical protein